MTEFKELIIKTTYDSYVDDVIKLLEKGKPGSLNKYLPIEHDDVTYPQIRIRDVESMESKLEEQIPSGFIIFEEREWDEKREVVHDAFFSGTMLLKLVTDEIRKYREEDILEDYLTYLIHSIMDPFFDHNKEAELHERLARRLRVSAIRAEENLRVKNEKAKRPDTQH